MQATSATWRALASTGTARLETVAVIGGREYAAISAPVISRALTQDGLSVGNAVAASCQFAVLTEDSIPRAAEVIIRMRLSDGETASEWLPAGTFYVSHREKEAVTGLTTLECYDAMLKANAAFDREGSWPRPMAQVASEIAAALGVALDSRTQLRTGDDFLMPLPEAGATIREVLGGIASVHGGNWVITHRNRLRLAPLFQSRDTAEVVGVLGGVSAGAAHTVTGLRVTGSGGERLIGSDGDLVLEINAPYATDGALAWLSGWLVGTRCQPFALRGAIYDPATELGDGVISKGDVASVLCCESATLGLAFRGDISAPEPEELADEFPYLGTGDRLKQLKGQVQALEETKADGEDVAAAEARANAAAQGYANAAQANAEAVARALDGALDQQEIFDRLTNDGESQGIYLKDGKLYLNGSYIDTGTLDADLIRAGTITDSGGDNYWILDGVNSEFVTRRGVIGDFTLEDGALQYGSLAVGGQGAYIGKDGVAYNVTLGNGNTSKVQVFAQGLEFYWNGARKTVLFLNTNGIVLRCYDENGAASDPIVVTDYSAYQSAVMNYSLSCNENVYAYKNLRVSGNATVLGDLSVSGTKARAVRTGQYADRLLYCYETPSPLFGDLGEGVIGEDGRCHVWLDPIFAGAVSDARYQVFLQAYGPGECRVAQRNASRFVVEGTPGLAFGWELKARQRDYDQRRLELADGLYAPEGTDYGALASKHIQNIQYGRTAV